MRQRFAPVLLAATLGAAVTTMTASPSAAQIIQPHALAVPAGEHAVTPIQYRRYGSRGYRGGYRGRSYRGGYRPYYRDPGAAIALGIVSGALIGGMLAAPPARSYYVEDDAVAYCMRRFRSYDPASGTYLGYDGLRHPCP